MLTGFSPFQFKESETDRVFTFYKQSLVDLQTDFN